MDIQAIQRRIDRLQGKRTAIQEEYHRLFNEIGIAKARQSHRESVDSVLETLEARFHARSLGVLEGLLGAFMDDVLPDETPHKDEDDPLPAICLEMDTLRGLPALQVSVRNGDHMEDALRGRGGAVVNILSAGLRFAALARTGNNPVEGFVYRPFIILDEADCWIQGYRVPAFSKVIHQLAKEMNLQVLMVSHHSADRLKGYPVHLEKVYPEITDENQNDLFSLPFVKVRAVPMAKKPEHGFRSITLRNFMSHKESVIPLSSGVTLLTGDNDIGKSAVAEAFRSICYNDSNDAVIRHGEDQSEVEIQLENDETLKWIRVRKGAPKVRYQLLSAGGEIIKETPSPKQVPDWVRNLLGIDLLRTANEAMDVQIGDQKSPVFLLDKSPAQRAAILDMGRESQYLRKLRDHWKKQVDNDRKSIRDGERRLSVIEPVLSALKDLDDLQMDYDLYSNAKERTETALKAVSVWQEGVDAQVRTKTVLGALKAIPESVLLPDRGAILHQVIQTQRMDESAKVKERLNCLHEFKIGGLVTPDLPDTFSDRIQQYRLLIESQRGFNVYSLWMDGKNAIPERVGLPVLHPVSERWLIAGSAASLKKKMKNLQGVPEVLKKHESINIDEVEKALTDLQSGYQKGLDAQSIKVSVRDIFHQLKKELLDQDSLENEKKSLLMKWGVCPFCGSSETHQHAV